MKSLVNASRLRHYTNGQDIRTQYPEDGLGQLFGDENETESEDEENNEADNQSDQLYNVERLLRMRKRAGKRQFYVKWEDGSKTWEPEENLSEDLIREYFVTHTKQGKNENFLRCSTKILQIMNSIIREHIGHANYLKIPHFFSNWLFKKKKKIKWCNLCLINTLCKQATNNLFLIRLL